jgi:hypothetical protein
MFLVGPEEVGRIVGALDRPEPVPGRLRVGLTNSAFSGVITRTPVDGAELWDRDRGGFVSEGGE